MRTLRDWGLLRAIRDTRRQLASLAEAEGRSLLERYIEGLTAEANRRGLALP